MNLFFMFLYVKNSVKHVSMGTNFEFGSGSVVSSVFFFSAAEKPLSMPPGASSGSQQIMRWSAAWKELGKEKKKNFFYLFCAI